MTARMRTNSAVQPRGPNAECRMQNAEARSTHHTGCCADSGNPQSACVRAAKICSRGRQLHKSGLRAARTARREFLHSAFRILHSRRAFTLFEVLIVIAILGVLAAFAWPTFFGERDAGALRETATRMKGLIAMCRAEAMNESRRYRVQYFQDGTIELATQRDAIIAPHEWVQVSTDWSRMQFIVDGVWVESVLALPGGPPPVLIDDETIEFADEDDYVQMRVEELEAPENLYFETDGTSDSARWVLRDTLGRGLELTLDGRLGRVDIKSIDRLDADEVKRPTPIEHKPLEEPQLREGERR